MAGTERDAKMLLDCHQRFIPKEQLSRCFNLLLYLLRANVLNIHVLKEHVEIFLFFVQIEHVFIWKIIFDYFFYHLFLIYFIC